MKILHSKFEKKKIGSAYKFIKAELSLSHVSNHASLYKEQNDKKES